MASIRIGIGENMEESEAIEKLKNMRLFMQIMDKNSEHKFAEDDYKTNEMAIQALEKQIPKKVKIEQWIYTKCDCGYEFSRHHGDGYYSIPLENKTKYCPNCGQRLNWGCEE